MKRPWWPHQRLALQYAIPRPKIGLLMDRRLGKSPVLVEWAKSKNPFSVLIVCPFSNVLDWVEECKLCGVKITPITRVFKGWEKKIRSGGWFVTNPEFIRSARNQWIAGLPWDVVAVDESTMLKNPKSQISQFCCGAFQEVPHRAILTGLARPESYLDLFQQMKFLFGQFMGYRVFWDWRAEVFDTDPSGYRWFPRPGMTEEIQDTVKRQCFVLTRKQAGMKEITVQQSYLVKMPPKLRRIYTQAESRWVLEDAEGGIKRTKWKIVQAQWLTKLAGGCAAECLTGHKSAALVDIVTNQFPKESIVVAFRYTAEILHAEQALKAAGVSCCVVNGKTPQVDRQRYKFLFNAKKIRVILVQAKCVQYGWNLSASTIIVWYSRYHSGSVNAQMADRVVFWGKEGPYLHIDIVTEDSIDGDVLKAVKDKRFESGMFTSNIFKHMKARLQHGRLIQDERSTHRHRAA